MTKPFPNSDATKPIEGILLVDKPKGSTSFSLVRLLRKRLGVKKIGHAGTLDPLATGVMVMLIGRRYTRLSDNFLCHDKEYVAEICLGITTDTYDAEGMVTAQSSHVPTLEDIQTVLKLFQGETKQIPPMFSAKKKQGKKLYELARKGQEVVRDPVKITLQTHFIRYEYPYLELRIACSKGTYIRSVAYDLGIELGCGAHLTNLRRTRSGKFNIEDCLNEAELHASSFNLQDRFLIEAEERI
jgi:tRNA pseudouridine55 synthase